MTAATTVSADLLVIGFGKGGKTLAAALARQGRRVVMVEQSDRMYGGTCINIGCVPTKSMVFRSEHLAPGGAHDGEYAKAVAATDALTTQLRATNLAMLETLDTATVLTGRAVFVDPHTVSVDLADGSTVHVTATHIVVGTGSEPVIPDIPGLRHSAVTVTSTTLLSTPALPRRLVVLGGGYVGLEFAAMYAQYGSEVTVLEHRDRILSGEDDDVAGCATEILTGAGLTVLTGADVTRVEDHSGPSATVHYTRDGVAGSVDGDVILAALGRRPVTADLNLAAAGIETTPRGAIAVDDHLRTSQDHVFAVGDVNGGPQFTYISLDDYRIVLDQLTGAGTRSTAQRTAVPYSLFMTPPLSRVGLTERQARESGRRVLVAAKPVAALATMPRARIVDDARGLMKVVVDGDTDEILGAALLSHESHEVINTVALAMRHGITAGQLRDEIYTHPSMTEGFNQLLGTLA
jgi:pyruvate/2-oxoglutarate dehydrogenase complex dihydrolipoamide dehydrogenase (E3) component